MLFDLKCQFTNQNPKPQTPQNPTSPDLNLNELRRNNSWKDRKSLSEGDALKANGGLKHGDVLSAPFRDLVRQVKEVKEEEEEGEDQPFDEHRLLLCKILI